VGPTSATEPDGAAVRSGITAARIHGVAMHGVDDVYRRCRDMGRNIGHTSVYQNLEALQSAGVIECLDRASGRLYGYRADPHSHLTCVETGQIQDLDVVLPPDLLRRIEAHTGYAIESYTLHLAGRRSAAAPLDPPAQPR
jgi:Fur family ferric uptake transcriptional regulator